MGLHACPIWGKFALPCPVLCSRETAHAELQTHMQKKKQTKQQDGVRVELKGVPKIRGCDTCGG